MKYELIYKNLPCPALRVFVEIEWCGPPDDTMVLHWTERENLKIFTIFFNRMGAAILEYCLEMNETNAPSVDDRCMPGFKGW